jgi:ParB family transcriptional regulator, chromosome partitioning protein
MEQLAYKNGSHKMLSISGGPLPLVFPPNEKRSPRFCVFDPKDGQVFSLPIDSIIEAGALSRPVINDGAQLSLIESIREYGLINPITVCFDNAFFLIAGRARLHAAKSAGKTMIPCMIKTGDPQLLSLIENLHRKSLTPIQEAEACKNLQQRLGLSQKTLAEKLKKSTTNMNDILRLNALPDEIKTDCRDDNRYSRRFFLDLLKQPTHEMMIAQLKAAADNTAPKSALEDPSVKQIETKNKPSHERQSRQKVLAKKLQSSIEAAAKLASLGVSAEERNEIRRLYELLGKLIMTT